MPRKITLIYIDSGGGHRAAANALREVIRRQQRPWDVQMTCIQDVLDSVDFVRKYTGIPFEEVYNIMLRRGWTLGSAPMIRAMHSVIRMSHASQVKALRRYWAQSEPDLVVSLIPHFNRAIQEALERCLARRSVCHSSDGHRGLSSAFLDRNRTLPPHSVRDLRF